MAIRHIVAQGEYLSLIASRYGFRDWKRIYEHPTNAAFRKKRPNPHVLLPGDEIFIPDRTPQTVQCDTGKKHRFVIKSRRRDELVIVLKTHLGDALTEEECVVSFTEGEGGEPIEPAVVVVTSGEGELRAAVPEDATHATITVSGQPWLRWQVAIGYLDPLTDTDVPFDARRCNITAIQSRLNNLGYPCGKVDGQLGPKTKAALRAFQRRALGRPKPDGVLDEETCGKLQIDHGC
jgi:N-acetylmuramoyl-L-alanine amidase